MKLLAIIGTLGILISSASQAHELKAGEVYRFCQIVIFNESQISTTDVVGDLLDNQSPPGVISVSEFDLSQDIESSHVAVLGKDKDATPYSLSISNKADISLKVTLASYNSVVIEDSLTGDASIGNNAYKSQQLPDGNTYIRTCGMAIGEEAP